jgi:hypothetical protein
VETKSDLEKWAYSLQREQAEILGVLKEFERYAVEGRLSEFQPQLNYLQLKADSKEKLKTERILFFAYGLFVGLIAEYVILTYDIGFGYISGLIIAAGFIGASYKIFKDIYNSSLKRGHNQFSSISRGILFSSMPLCGILFFLLFVYYMKIIRDTTGILGTILYIAIYVIGSTLILGLIGMWVSKKPKHKIDGET